MVKIILNNNFILVKIIIGDSMNTSKMDINKMEELGVSEYYLDLSKYIYNFVDRNYPLTKEDMRALMPNTKTAEIDGEIKVISEEPIVLTENLKHRNEITNLMKQRLQEILKEKAEENFKGIKVENIDEYKQNIFNYEQRLLEDVWEYRRANGLLETQVMIKNSEYIKYAIEEGISAEAVQSTLSDVINKINDKGETPKQVQNTIETIADMKKTVENIYNEQYQSDFVKENNEKINSALNEGVEPEEIATALIDSVENANTKEDKQDLKFTVNFISKMKEKDLKLNKEKESVEEKGMQRVLK